MNPAPGAPPESAVLPGLRDARDPDRSLTPVGHGYSREEIAALQQDRLRDAVVQVIATEGLEGAHIKTICARAGVGLATFYEHFHSKQELVLAAYDAGVAVLFEVVAGAYDAPAAGTTSRDRTERGILALLRALADNPAFARFFLVEFAKAGREAQERVEASLDASFELFNGMEPEVGAGSPDPEMVPMLVSGVYGQLERYVRLGRTAELPTLLPSLMRFSQAVLGGSGVSTINLQPPRPGVI
ncbi:TetR/AcrR family transcriptional regulator [Marmoricola sp. RAF53]|uniref:TetR/AcrR family transcriptional regulator n=1 Tax=Marmoricola sp. RAF53 TaxID=3233059 RepID=UPI003F9AC54E